MNPKYKPSVILSTLLLAIGLFIWILEEIKFLTPERSGNYFGAVSWTSGTIFLIGNILCLIFIPILYITGYADCKKTDNSWKTKLILIYPLFLFGVFFQFVGNSIFIYLTLPISLLIILTVHIILMVISGFKNKPYFFRHLFFLLVFYLLLFILELFFNFFKLMKDVLF